MAPRCWQRCSPRWWSFDENNKPVEAAAESIESTDNTTWTIKLKDGYTFHNGEKVTADSYIDAWNYGAYGPNGQDNNYFFDKIDGYAALNPADPDADGPAMPPTPPTNELSGLKKVDDATFTVTLSEPFSGLQVRARLHGLLPAAPGRLRGGRLGQRRRTRTPRSVRVRSR